MTSRRKNHALIVGAGVATLCAVAATAYYLYATPAMDPLSKEAAAAKKTLPNPKTPTGSLAKGYVLSISINNIIMWNPSLDPLNPTYAFHPQSLKFLVGLLQSPSRPTVHLISTVVSPTQTDQIMELLRSNGLFSKGLDPRRVLFCDTVQGRVHLVKHLGSIVHVDDDDGVLTDLLPFVKRLVRVKRQVKVSIEADKRRMSVSSIRSRNSSSPPPMSPLVAASVLQKPYSRPPSRPGSIVHEEQLGYMQQQQHGQRIPSRTNSDHTDEEDEGVGSTDGSSLEDAPVATESQPRNASTISVSARPSSSSTAGIPIPPVPHHQQQNQEKFSVYQSLMRSLPIPTPKKPNLKVVNATPHTTSSDEDDNQHQQHQQQLLYQQPFNSPTKQLPQHQAQGVGAVGFLVRTTSQASFKSPSSSSSAGGLNRSMVASANEHIQQSVQVVVPEVLRTASNVEFVEGIEMCSLAV